ncbi:hypothetical protein ABZX72_13980 [Streptomyces cyaneofuscatus]|uniref:hypothetical protein n=1 Tax=Streptomyces cyaneofuscatus TaxID=66883 RepID=UPI0033B2C95D
MAGRRLKELPADGSARTRLAERLRLLKKECGDPTYQEISQRTGYSRTVLSGLFNGRLPSRELLQDVVQGLGGKDTQEWVRLLDQAHREESRAPGLAEELKEARDEIATLKLAIANPNAGAYWANLKLNAADRQVQNAGDLEHSAAQILSRAQVEIRRLTDRRDDIERECAEMTRTATEQATLAEEQAQLVATATLRSAEDTAAHMVDAARAEAERIKTDAQIHASSLHGKAGAQVDALLQEADDVADAARREAERLKARARIEIQRMVREAQEALNRVGQHQSAQLLEQLLIDFAIGDVHSDVGQTGRHRRTALLPSPAASSEVTG